MNLKSMSLARLIELRDQVDAVLSSKVANERRTIQEAILELSRVSSNAGRGSRGKVAPKFRNPQNPAETWAGRGLKPRWLTAALKAGHKLDEFRVGRTEQRATPGKPKTVDKPKAASKGAAQSKPRKVATVAPRRAATPKPVSSQQPKRPAAKPKPAAPFDSKSAAPIPATSQPALPPALPPVSSEQV